jgi:hypothetical protein
MPESLSLWLCFALGQFTHVLKRAGMAVRSRTNTLTSRREYLRFYWDALLVRSLLCAALFWLVQRQPALLAQVAAAFGAAPVELPLTGGTALVFGYFADSILDWLVSRVPALGRELPSVNGSSDAKS